MSVKYDSYVETVRSRSTIRGLEKRVADLEAELAATEDDSEQGVVAKVFADLLRSATKDGGRKRAKNEKPPWWRDSTHEAALFSHIAKWKKGAVRDEDSGAHPLVHLAWRALAIAYQETQGRKDPAPGAPTLPFTVTMQGAEYVVYNPDREREC